jgi:hypothetical protein
MKATVCEIQISAGEHSDEPISMGIIPAQNKIQPTSNEQRNYTSSGTSSRRKIFIQPLNAQRSNVYTYWAYCSFDQKALQIG